jgi:DNA-binding NtrC family response regulator
VFAPETSSASIATLTRESIEIGREPSGAHALTVPDREVSRVHAAAEYDEAEDAWWIVDRGSRNGILVDGVKTARAKLRHGSVVRVGRSLIVHSDTAMRAGEPLAPETAALRGNSLAMQRVRGEIDLVAPRDIAVLVLGETGTGKERVAEEIHRLSGRGGAFVAVNCASIPESLAESELFGHAPGAFTGAREKSDGLFVAAHRGTLFLDEVGELPIALQPKLLRALAAGEVRAVGKSEARKVDVRIVAATHRDMSGDLASKAFRADLYARLEGWTLRLPPLRDRREDILRLARLILDRSPGPPALTANAAEALLLFDWPFNVRQLEQVLAVSAIRAAKEGTLRVAHLPEALGAPLAVRRETAAKRPSEPPLEVRVARDTVPSASALTLVLSHYRGNLAEVAHYFGKDRRQIYRWAERHGIDVDSFRAK